MIGRHYALIHSKLNTPCSRNSTKLALEQSNGFNPRVGPGILLRYLLGNAAAIRTVAQSRAAFGTGIVLVLLTTIPRNYDQTFIGESPWRWIFGSLVFSLISGTWLYLMAYGNVRLHLAAKESRPPHWKAWPAFMGLFWLTAPIAWIYAIPVEHFMSSLDAAQANVLFLGIVSVWRVALMIRVLHVLSGTPVWITTLWVLTAALGEVFLLTFFGGTFARALAAGMGGMRNSPEEEVIMSVLGTALSVSFWGFPILLLVSVLLNCNFDVQQKLSDLPTRNTDRMHWRWLAVCALAWIAVAILPQQQVQLNAEVDRLTAAENYTGAIEFLSLHTPDEFAPSRQLPPKPFEREVFKQLPQFMDQLRPDHPAWVRAHFMRRLDEFCTHFQSRGHVAESDRIRWIANRLRRVGRMGHQDCKPLVHGLAKLSEGREWVRTNNTLIPGLEFYVAGFHGRTNGSTRPKPEVLADWREMTQVINRIKASHE
jgi:hypothetical protein